MLTIFSVLRLSMNIHTIHPCILNVRKLHYAHSIQQILIKLLLVRCTLKMSKHLSARHWTEWRAPSRRDFTTRRWLAWRFLQHLTMRLISHCFTSAGPNDISNKTSTQKANYYHNSINMPILSKQNLLRWNMPCRQWRDFKGFIPTYRKKTMINLVAGVTAHFILR